MTRNADLILRNHKIKEDENGFVCLNDIHAIANASSSRTPPRWRDLPTTKELESAMLQNTRFSGVIAKTEKKTAAYSKQGKGGGTFAHYILGLAYAEYLSPELAIEVKDVYVRLRTGDPDLINEISAKADAARKWNDTRDASKAARERFAGVLTDRDCDGRAIGFVTNAIYKVLLGGTAKQVRATMKLPATGSIRDNLPLKELVQTMATEVMASERIEDDSNCRGRQKCYSATARAAHFVKDAFDREREDRKSPR